MGGFRVMFRLLCFLVVFSAFDVPLFKCCTFAYMLYQCFRLRDFSTKADVKIYKSTRSPIHMYRMVSNISLSFPMFINRP